MDPMISSDSHIVEPPELWERWLTPELRPRAPKLVKDEEGGDAWLYNDGGAPAPLGLVTVTRGRPRVGVEAAIAEMRRCKEMGLRGVLLSAWPSGNLNLSEADDAFFAEAERLGLPISIHCGLSARGKVPSKPKTPTEEKAARGEATGGKQVSALSGAGLDTMPLIMGEIILTGVHDRFPTLKFVSVEAGIGWVPYYTEQMDDRYDRNKYWAKIKLDKQPSEYVRSNWWFTFIIDHYGVANRHAIGIDNIMWSTDYPHHGCDWPHSRRVVGEMMKDVPAAERRKIVLENAARLYGIRVGE